MNLEELRGKIRVLAMDIIDLADDGDTADLDDAAVALAELCIELATVEDWIVVES